MVKERTQYNTSKKYIERVSKQTTIQERIEATIWIVGFMVLINIILTIYI